MPPTNLQVLIKDVASIRLLAFGVSRRGGDLLWLLLLLARAELLRSTGLWLARLLLHPTRRRARALH